MLNLFKKKFVTLKNKSGVFKEYRVYKLSDLLYENRKLYGKSNIKKVAFRNFLVAEALKFTNNEGIEYDKVFKIDA